ncbi:conserved hypothetical protein [Perkinsus marinus ATCC 50983]|uniref:proton-translocating NAD(P)(+) transhydrogenase n=1 Tax=Perkinsus marinus (strain ATCC 50983 / TXsc) TaxID=423536 RepID=C5KBF8_PERM5|nr:conserved hypothetical protein [Perkinsus marinus ATCC 50983]EER18484.1 conserved hypothetical protein [Perkinsus marinus ATCC 50983]|eukprot:XP_002786688.1 conserved hypothetical protein [Perkinsus marinus ATCC 50983]
MDWADWLGDAAKEEDRRDADSNEEESVVALHVPRIHRILWIPLSLAAGSLFLEALPPTSILAGTAVGSTGSFGALVTSFAKASGAAIAAAGSNALSVTLPMASTILFMFSLRGLNSHETSKRGNWLGVVGAASAVVTVVATTWIPQYSSSVLLRSMGLFMPTAAAACAVGLGVASCVQMEEMPQLVAGFHSFTGLAAVLIGLSAHLNPSATAAGGALAQALETFIGVSVGAATFSGSVVAALKLHGTIPGRPIGMKIRGPINGLCLTKLALLTTVYCGVGTPWVRTGALLANMTASAMIGAMMVLPVGGADMPVIVSLLNSLSGLATSASGFMMSNSMLVMTGALVTSSGALLSDIMCRGINRSLVSVLQGGFGVEDGSLAVPSGGTVAGEVHTIDSAELVRKLTHAKKVLIVPGYGMAVARCQQQVSEIANLLRNRNGAMVVFGIHPVAGRLPGHMNVLLAEANVPYDIVLEMEEVNAEIASFDLCIVLGANDIVNPTTGSDPSSPIYGMPAIEVWKCRECIVLKRSMATGYSGVENPLFFHENSRMLFGHAREMMDKIRNELVDQLPSEDVVQQGPTAVVGETGNSAGKDGSSDSSTEEQRIEYPPVGVMVGFVNECIFESAEATETERRVAVTPVVTRKLRMLGFDVAFEEGSGEAAGFSDEEYELMGATRLKTAEEVYAKADVMLRVGALCGKDVRLCRDGNSPEGSVQVVISTFPVNDEVLALLEQFRARKVTVINMAAVPRISRAQKLDVLTSMANIAGYRAVVEAFHVLPRISRPSVTASGHLPAASVFVIGTGVAGLSAVATAQSLGARVYASDVRDTTKEQIESMGATFVRIECRELSGAGGVGGYAAEISSPEFKRAQMETYAAMVKKVDVVICTAMIPNRRAPVLVTAAMVRSMAPHSVIVDLAATAGGNCELTVPGRTLVDGVSKVTLVGRTTLTSDMPQQSSTMLSHNLLGMLQLLRKDTSSGEVGGPASLTFNFDDVVVRQSTFTRDGEMLYPPPPMPQPPTPVPPSLPVGVELLPMMHRDDSNAQAVLDYLCDHSEAVAVALGFTVVLALGISADVNNVRLVGDFVLSLLIGHFTVAAVTPALHTPLISVTNAISGVIATGGMLQMNGPFPSGQVVSALAAVFFSLVNVSGGFAITHRMLQMFKPAQTRAILDGPRPADVDVARRVN